MALRSICIICFEDARSVTGGVQRRIAAEIDYFSKRGVAVTAISAGIEGNAVIGTVAYISVPTPNIIYPLRTLIFSFRVSRLLRKMPAFDVIESHHDAGATALLSRSLRRAGTRFVEVVHGVFRDEFEVVRQFEKPFSQATLAASGLLPLSLIEQAASRRSDAVVTVSEYSSERITKHYGVPAERITVSPNGIDTARYSPPASRSVHADGEMRVLYVGKWHARKGVLQLIQAFGIAHATNNSLRLRMVGGGPLEGALRSEVSKLGLDGAVEFLGKLDDETVIREYRAADMVCIPSLQEGQGIVALEAQACGAPIVATRAGGLIEAVQDGVTGLVVTPGDIEGLAAALIQMASDEEMRREYGRNAVAWARRFQWDRLLDDLNSKYQGLQSNARLASTVPLHRSEA